ncbi:MAG TPA: 3-phosphoshikimate 1-carboxyvinyltransferase [Tepidisphaeraceae bacterium]|jgi:3-phosphoshikimate 1-carboxyvinyltransferase
MSDLRIEPITKPFNLTFTPPGSKSLTNRALICAALADGPCVLRNVLFADDTEVMLQNLEKLGFEPKISRDGEVAISGRGGSVPNHGGHLVCGNSGTTIRFLSALVSLGRGMYLLDGVERMRQRPIGALMTMLKNLGVRLKYVGEDGYPPVEIVADSLPGGIVRYGSEMSSQYLSAVLMVAPYAKHEVTVHLDGPQTSWPYVAMTMQLMDTFGVTPELHRHPDTGVPKTIHIPREKYRATDYTVEPDSSNASYFLAAAALHEGAKITIEGLGKSSLQGDVGFADVLHRMGAGLVFGKDFITVMGAKTLEGIEVDLSDMPDVAQTLAVVALFANGETRIRGLHTLRVKETDRIAALANELRKLGADVDEGEDELTIGPPEKIKVADIDTYDDHRMAMSFALAGTRSAGVRIRNIECVNKTYPKFFQDLQKLY